MGDDAENIRVAVRCRPISKKEIAEGAKSVFSRMGQEAVMTNPEDANDVHRFAYDFVYDDQVGAPRLRFCCY